MKFLWKIGGEAGFGIMTSGLLFSKIATRSGYHIFDYAEYPSLIRGGHNTYEVLVSDEEVGTTQQSIDLLVCLNKDTYEMHKSRLSPESLVVYDQEAFTIDHPEIKRIPVPFKEILKELQAPQIMSNTTALGASLALIGGDLKILHNLISEQFKRKGETVVNYNMQFAQKGHDFVKNTYGQYTKNILTTKSESEKVVVSGNEALSLGAVAANCRFYAAYPMTPTSNILSVLAAWQQKAGIVARHAEDEISVINTALGASHNGVRSSVGTSGGGFALMVETLSYAGVAEIPMVVFLGQRPGPATGMPTWTEQGDLLFACHAGHGEFPKIVLAPGDIFEAMELTLKAFDLADVYQLPVVVICDKLLCESHKSHPREEVTNLFANYHPNRGKTALGASSSPYLRYKVTDDGISERLIPGSPGAFYQANSYEHTEDSHTTEDARERTAQVDKRNKKWDTYLSRDFTSPQVFGDIQAKTVFVSWGSNKGAILDAQKQLSAKGISTTYIHFTHLYPLNEEKVRAVIPENKRVILIENNSHGQFGKLLMMEIGIEIKEKLLKYDGRPVWTEEIIRFVEKI